MTAPLFEKYKVIWKHDWNISLKICK